MIIRCNVCGADPCGRWKSPPAMIFGDRYREDGSTRKDDKPRGFARLPRPLIGEARGRDPKAGEGPRVEEGRAAMNAGLERGEVIGFVRHPENDSGYLHTSGRGRYR